MKDGLRHFWLGRLVSRFYPKLPFNTRILKIVVSREGGQFTSGTLREVLASEYGIKAGAHSYGSLLEPGMCDALTTIGRYVSVGPNVRRFGAAHPIHQSLMHPYWYNPFLNFATKDQDVTRTKLEICHESWIGANVTILPSCERIGIGSVIGAGSVVTHDVADFEIVAGNPARNLGWRLTEEQRSKLQEDRPWELEPSEILEALKSRIPVQPEADRG